MIPRQAQILNFIAEPLETRSMLAGMVSVSLDGQGIVTLNGDFESNLVHVHYNADRQAHIWANDGTQFKWNDSVTNNFQISEISGLSIQLRGGDDQLRIRGSRQAQLDALTIRTLSLIHI